MSFLSTESYDDDNGGDDYTCKVLMSITKEILYQEWPSWWSPARAAHHGRQAPGKRRRCDGIAMRWRDVRVLERANDEM